MLFLTQLFGGTGSDRHLGARSTCTAAGFTRVSPPAARWLSARMATLFRVIMTHTTPNFDDFQLEIMLKELVNAPRH